MQEKKKSFRDKYLEQKVVHNNDVRYIKSLKIMREKEIIKRKAAEQLLAAVIKQEAGIEGEYHILREDVNKSSADDIMACFDAERQMFAFKVIDKVSE